MKEFGISYNQLAEEPLDFINIAMQIRQMDIERQEREAERSKRLSKLNG